MSEIETTRVDGVKERIEKRNIQIAKSLLDILDNETISLKTDLNIDFIEKFRK